VSGTHKDIPTINGTGVVGWAKSHYGCQSLMGLAFENEGASGTAGSHWEMSILGNEIMTGVVNAKMVIGAATINFFQDSGLYTMTMGLQESNFYGQDQGCFFLNGNCSSTYREFDTQRVWRCSYDFTSKTVGVKSTTSDGCYIQTYIAGGNCNRGTYHQMSAYGESSGPGSRCIPTSIYNGQGKPWVATIACFQTKCQNGQIVITSDSQETFFCNKTGQNISIHAATNITCPNINDFCGNLTSNANCPSDCNGHGRCLANGQCGCFFLYSGAECATKKQCTYGTEVCGVVASPSQSANTTQPANSTQSNGSTTATSGSETQSNGTKATNFTFSNSGASHRIAGLEVLILVATLVVR